MVFFLVIALFAIFALWFSFIVWLVSRIDNTFIAIPILVVGLMGVPIGLAAHFTS